MLDMNHEKSKYVEKLKKALNERDTFIEKAANYEELIDIYGTKENLDFDELEREGDDLRGFEILEKTIWIFGKIISTIDDRHNSGDDKKAIHRNKKNAETLVTSFREIKHESEAIILREQELIKEVNEALDFLSFVRE